jgi:hypothetical protein
MSELSYDEGASHTQRTGWTGWIIVAASMMIIADSLNVLYGMDERRAGRPLPVLAATARHEGLGPDRDDGPGDTRVLRHMCGWTLARAHARSGDAVSLAAYLGTKGRFEDSIVEFSQRYADQNEQDYQAFTEAIRSGRLEAVEGV